MKKHVLLVIIAAIPGLGYTNCQYFSATTVPTTDTNPPSAIISVWEDGEESVYLSPVDLITHDPAANFLVVGSIYDGGGAKEVWLSHAIKVRCSSASGYSSLSHVDLAPMHDIEPAAPGATVSNGRYVYSPIRFDDFDYCSSGFSLTDVTYAWSVHGTDYHGNEAWNSGSLTYTP